jgi:thimet oligopeptidase
MGAATRAWTNTYALIPFPEYAQFQDAFGHLDGYSAFYYTYLWSRVIAADLFTRFEDEGLRNAQTAEAYRRLFLEASATQPAAVIIRDFLGRDVSLDAFRSTLEQGLE